MEKSIFLEVVGDSSTMKVLQYLIEGRDFDYTLTDIAENAGVSWGTLHTIFPRLIKRNIVIKTRDIGRAKLYKINIENQIAKKLIDLYDYIILNALKKHQEKKVITAVA
ncbi:MAG: winged helix-turn-helix domain-containing protein [Candidatus Woesearchaeota archaeon]